MSIAATKPELGRIGFWRGGGLLTPELAAAAERFGYGTVWIGGGHPQPISRWRNRCSRRHRRSPSRRGS